MGSRRRGRYQGGAIEKFRVTLLHNPSQHCTVNCDALNVSQIVCDAIQKGHSIEKFQHHPPHYFSSLFHAEICHVTLIDIRSNGCTSFLELRRMASSKNAEHSHVILIKGRAWGLYPCSTKTRESLGNSSRRPRDFPRPERFPEGNLEGRGKSRGSREISRAGGMDFPIPPKFWWSTDILLIINPIPRDGSGNPSL